MSFTRRVSQCAGSFHGRECGLQPQRSHLGVDLLRPDRLQHQGGRVRSTPLRLPQPPTLRLDLGVFHVVEFVEGVAQEFALRMKLPVLLPHHLSRAGVGVQGWKERFINLIPRETSRPYDTLT